MKEETCDRKSCIRKLNKTLKEKKIKERIYYCGICPKEVSFKRKFCCREHTWISAHMYTGESIEQFNQRRKAKGLRTIPKRF